MQIHPEALGITKKLGKSERCARRDASAAVYDFVDPVIRDMNSISKVTLRKPHREQEFFEQHFAAVGWFPVCGNSNHWGN